MNTESDDESRVMRLRFGETALRRIRALYSTRQAAKLQWALERAEWEARGVSIRTLQGSVLVPETGSVFIPVAKAANSSIKQLIAPAGQWKSVIDAGLTLNDLAGGSVSLFTFVRDPVDRFWSAYANKIVRHPSGPFPNQIRARLRLPADSELPPESVLEWLEMQTPAEMEEHFMPQWYTTAIDCLPISFVGRVESLSADIATARRQGLLPPGIDIPHLNRSDSGMLKSEALRPRIANIYQRDLEIFGYGM